MLRSLFVTFCIWHYFFVILLRWRNKRWLGLTAVVHWCSVNCQFQHNGWRLRGAGATLQRGVVVRNLLQSAPDGRGSSRGQQHGVWRLLPASAARRSASQRPVRWDEYQCQMGANGGFWDLHSQSRYRHPSCLYLPFLKLAVCNMPLLSVHLWVAFIVNMSLWWCRATLFSFVVSGLRQIHVFSSRCIIMSKQVTLLSSSES